MRLRIPKSVISILAAAAILAGCAADNSGQSSLEKAATALSDGNYAAAQKTCDGLMADSAAFDALSVAQLCSLAEMYVRIESEQQRDTHAVADVNDASAARCLSRARSIDSDSVDAFIGTLPRETAQRLTVINRVSTYLDIPRDSLAIDEPSDTL